jgi:alpha-1,3-mannosyltransferase
MRVLHVSRFFHPKIGGTENYIAHLADATSEHGIESTVLATRRHADGVPRPRVPVRRIATIGPDWFPLALDVPSVRNHVRSSDVVHVHDLRFAFELVTACGLAEGVPLVFSTHGLVFHTPRLGRLKKRLWSSYYRALLGRFAAVLCSSRQDFELCRRAGLGNARLFPNPVRTAPFETVDPQGPSEGALVYFGRLAPNKGIERLAGVLAHAPSDWTLTVIGKADDGYDERLRGVMADFGGRVSLCGEVAENELPELIARHDCVVLPSYTEGFGLTLIEALATGVPVVASDIASYRELAAGTGVELVDFDRPDDAVRAIRSAVETWNATAARAYARGFSWERQAPALVSLYEAVCR